MEDFFPFLQNPVDTGSDAGTHLPQRRHAGVPMHSPSSQLPFKLSNEYIKRALPQRLGPVVSQNCKFKRLDSHERLFVLPCY